MCVRVQSSDRWTPGTAAHAACWCGKKLLVEIGATRTWVSIDPLKPYVGAGAPVVAQPPIHISLRKN